jgi:hypothetical protein
MLTTNYKPFLFSKGEAVLQLALTHSHLAIRTASKVTVFNSSNLREVGSLEAGGVQDLLLGGALFTLEKQCLRRWQLFPAVKFDDRLDLPRGVACLDSGYLILAQPDSVTLVPADNFHQAVEFEAEGVKQPRIFLAEGLVLMFYLKEDLTLALKAL